MIAPETIYLYPWHDTDGSITIRALSESGERVLESYKILASGTHDGAEVACIVAAMNKDIRAKHPRKRIVYTPDPHAHPALAAILAELSKTAQEKEEEDAPEPPVPTVSLCELCSHKNICATATFSQGIGALISVCPEYGEQDDREHTEEEA
jgi:hypothetical protein